MIINPADMAPSSNGDHERFWKVFDGRPELYYWVPMCCHERLEDTLSDAAPIPWQCGVLA